MLNKKPRKDRHSGRRWKGLECNNGIRHLDVKKLPHLRTRRKTAKSIGGRNRRDQPQLEGMGNGNEIFWKTCELEFTKQAVRIPSRLRQIRNWRVWSAWTPSETEQPDATELTETFVGSHSGRAALRRQWW
jgi:hypothetical protein